jgi:hypothetical protein
VLSLTEGTRRAKGTAVEDEGDPSGGSVVCDMLCFFGNEDKMMAHAVRRQPMKYRV